MFNSIYAEKLNVLSLNTHADKKTSKPSGNLTDAERELALSINREDQLLYRAALAIFETRLSLQARNLRYVHGKVQKIKGQRLEGWAIDNAAPETAVELDIYCNGNLVARKTAKEYVASMKERNAERDGYVGFVHVFEHTLKADDQIQVRVSTSGQVLRGPTRATIQSSREKDHRGIKTPSDSTLQLSVIDGSSHYGVSMGKAANE